MSSLVCASVRIEVLPHLRPEFFDLRPGSVKETAYICFRTTRPGVVLSIRTRSAEEGVWADGVAPLLHAPYAEGAACLCCFAPQTNVVISFRIRKAEEGAYPLYVLEFL